MQYPRNGRSLVWVTYANSSTAKACLKLRVPVKGVRARLIPSALELEECRSFGRDLARQLAGTHDKQIIDMAALA